MHIRGITKAAPEKASANNVVTLLDIVSYLINIVAEMNTLIQNFSQKNNTNT